MSLGLDDVRGLMVSHLEDCGLSVVTAWDNEGRHFDGVPVVAVSLRKCTAGQSGFANYLGERFNDVTNLWEEIYARKMSVTLGLDIYAPVGVGEEAVIATFDQMVEALTQNAPSGMNLEEFSCGETQYDQEERLLKRTVEAQCALYLYAVATAGETFLDFKVKGERV